MTLTHAQLEQELISIYFGSPTPTFSPEGLDAPPDVDAFKRAGEKAVENVESLRQLKTTLEGAMMTHVNSPSLATYNALQSVISEVARRESELFEPDLPDGSQFTDLSRQGFSHPVVRKTGAQFLRARKFYYDLYNVVLEKAIAFNISDFLTPNASNASNSVVGGPATQNAITALRAEVQKVQEGQLDLTRKTKSTMPSDSRLARLMSLLSKDDPLYTQEYKNARATAYYAHLSSVSKGHESVMNKFQKLTDRLMAEPHISEGRLVYEDGRRLYDHFTHVESLLKTLLVTYFPEMLRHLTDPNAPPLAHDPREITLIECVGKTLGPAFTRWWTKQDFPPYHRAMHDYTTFKLIVLLQFTPPDMDRWSKLELERHCKSYMPGKTEFAAWYYNIKQLREVNSPAEEGFEITKAAAFQQMRAGLPSYIEKEFRRLHYTHETPEEEIRFTALTEESMNDFSRKEQGHSHPDYGGANALAREDHLRRGRDSHRSQSQRRLSASRRRSSSQLRSTPKGSLNAIGADDDYEPYDADKGEEFVQSDDEFYNSDSDHDGEQGNLSPEEADDHIMAVYNLNAIDARKPSERQALLKNKSYNLRCHFCNEVGHFMRDCPHRNSSTRPDRGSFNRRNNRSVGQRKYFRQSARTMQILEVKGAATASQAIDILEREGRSGDLLMIRDGNEYFAVA
jgi:hypothetical protein